MSANPPPRWVLRPLGVAGMPPVVDVPGDGLTIGRDPACSLRLPSDDFPQVSAQHARITPQGDALRVVDLGSRNGTLVNGVPTDAAELRNGDVLQLGDGGPRFAAVLDSGLDDTMDAVPARARRRPLGALGDSTIIHLRTALGVADKKDVEGAVERSSRRTISITLAVGALVLVLAGVGIWATGERGRRETDDLRAMNDSLRAEIERQRAEITAQRESLDAERDAVAAERDELNRRIASIEEGAGGAGDVEERLGTELANLRSRLDEANARLERFDPVNLERERLREVQRVHEAVVLIEATARFRDTHSRKRLYLARLPDGREVPNLEFEGEVLKQESTGSGFCIDADGYILTNAHVVMPMDRRDQVRGPGGLLFDVETDLQVVFTDTDTRHEAKVVSVTRDADEDLALIKIEPFDGMPVIEDFSTATETPAAGTEVYLFGFPLGKLVLQEGDRVVASTFKGILSRAVGGYLQIDASVHPGNSGGPVTDSAGRVVGVVVRVQSTPGGTIQNSIGYVIPIENAASVWSGDGPVVR